MEQEIGIASHGLENLSINYQLYVNALCEFKGNVFILIIIFTTVKILYTGCWEKFRLLK